MTTGTSKGKARLNFKGLLGPALVAGVAYIDPGNIATNLTAGSRFGYLLVWVLVAATLSAALFQFLAAKLGLATGQSLTALLGGRFKSNAGRIAFWLQAEAVAIATDVAEVLGGAIALTLLTGLPTLVSALVVALVSLVITALRSRAKGEFTGVVIFLLLCATAGFVTIMARSNIDWIQVSGGLLPRFDGTESLLLAASIIGATIMPHAIYAHSALSRDTRETNHGLGLPGKHWSLGRLGVIRLDVAVAMTIAGLGNLAIILFSAANLSGKHGATTLLNAPQLPDSQPGKGIGVVFILALFSSGIASSAVGNYAADEITVGLLKRKVSPLARWLLALVPALGLIAFSPNVTDAVVYSQVVLSFGLPFAIFPLVKLTANRQVMGSFTNPRLVTALGYTIAALLTVLNLVLVFSLFFGA